LRSHVRVPPVADAALTNPRPSTSRFNVTFARLFKLGVVLTSTRQIVEINMEQM